MPRAHLPASNQHRGMTIRTALMPSSTRCSGASVMFEAEALEHFEPALAGAELLGLHVVRHDVAGIDVGPLVDLADVVAEFDAGGFVVVDEVDLAADDLREPDRGGVADAEVPCGPHQRGRVVGHAGYAPVGFGLRHQLAVIGADDGGLERAFELLHVLLLAQIAAGERELARRDEAGLARLQHQANQPSSACARRHSSKKALRPFGVPMNTAQPCRSASAGRMISDHTRGSMSAYSSSTMPSR